MPDIRHSILVSAKPDEIYPLVASGKGFGHWWATDVTEFSGRVELGFFNRATVYRLRPTIERPSSHFEWICESGDEWSGTRIIFQFEAAKSNALLRFTHAGWRTESDYFISCNTTWGELIFRLKAVAEGREPGPLFTRESWIA